MPSVHSFHSDPHTRPSNGAAPFKAGEVFFSRTDQRGVIQSGNAVFARVSAFGWDELIGAPHKLIRHPDMPKGVFYILWDRILAGKPVAAYVKNKAKDGLYYWVFAVVTPSGDGFLSARIKPTSARCGTMEELYAKLRHCEQEEGLTPEASAAAIDEAVRDLGFDGYEDFAADSLSEELMSESQTIGTEPPARIMTARNLLSRVHNLGEEAAALMTAFEALAAVPRNLQIKAKRLEPTGGPLTALSSDYGRMSQEMSTWFMKNVAGQEDNFTKVATRIKEVLLYNGTREILCRCNAELIQTKEHYEGFDAEKERGALVDLIASFSAASGEELTALEREASRLSKACKEMRRSLLGLNTVRVTGKIENARLTGDTSSLGEIIEHLGASQLRVEQHLECVKNEIDAVWRGVKEAQALERRAEINGRNSYPYDRRTSAVR